MTINDNEDEAYSEPSIEGPKPTSIQRMKYATVPLNTKSASFERRKAVIDYSKWDKMDFSDDSIGSEADTNTSCAQLCRPRITRFDERSSVTWTGSGSLIFTRGSKNDKEKEGCSQNETFPSVETCGGKSIAPSIILDPEKISLLTKNGGVFHDKRTDCEVYWSQDRYEVVLSIDFNSSKIGSRNIRVKVTGAFSYEDRHCATVSNGKKAQNGKGTVTVWNNMAVLLKGELSHFIHLAEGEEGVDWEIDTSSASKKLIRITLLKALPMQGLTIWWNRPLMNFPEINVADIECRCNMGSTVKNRVNMVDRKDSQGKMKEVWEEAHGLFLEKVKNRKKIELTNIDN